MRLDSKIEAILFATAESLTIRRLADMCEEKKEAVQTAVDQLAKRLDEQDGALTLARAGDHVELVTRPAFADLVRQAVKRDAEGELTRPSLEALAILAYRGPLTRPELEQIRGVQSSLILRNLMLRGLVEMKEDARLGQPLYAVTIDFLKHIGMKDAESLPNYQELRGNASVEQVLDELDPVDQERGKTQAI